MSERKVLNKYYPPEFDPSKIPRVKREGGKNGTFSIRVMAPFNMRCNTCGEYIYKGKKFNSRKENVDDEDYLGLKIFRFYIRCPRCVAEIAFKTDIANVDYTCEAGATRLFEAERLAHQMAAAEKKQQEEDELNPMKVLENRTAASQREMEQIDQLEELQKINAGHAGVDTQAMLEMNKIYQEKLLKLQEEEEDNMVKAILNQGTSGEIIRRIDDSKKDDVSKAKKPKLDPPQKATDILADSTSTKAEEKQKESWQRSIGSFSKKTSLQGLVKRKVPAAKEAETKQSGTNKVSKDISQPSSSSSAAAQSSTTNKPTLGALGALGYSDSDTSDSD